LGYRKFIDVPIKKYFGVIHIIRRPFAIAVHVEQAIFIIDEALVCILSIP